MQSFFFYDLETSGLNPRADRIMQFAGQRTDLDLKPIGDPINLLVKLNDDTLPSPYAIVVTGITPQSTQQDGLTEAELARYLTEEVFTPGTCAVGYNSVRFDDEFMRHLFWRSFYDPYEWTWKDGRSRWDLLDVVRLTRALRPEGIEWPIDKDGKATNRLELLTKLNGISHEAAHDALSDVTALIDVTRLIKSKQPQLFDYLLKLRDKKAVAKLVNLDHKQPFVYASGRYDPQFNKTTVAFPLTTGQNGNVVVYDLRHDPTPFFDMDLEAEVPKYTSKERSPSAPSIYPTIKELVYNKCPAVAPLGVLEQDDGWVKIGLIQATIEKNLKTLISRPDFAEKIRTHFEKEKDWGAPADPESALYEGFIDGQDKIRIEAVRNADSTKLADFNPDFADDRLPGLLLHYKARNYPRSLSAAEYEIWEEYRTTRLQKQMPDYIAALTELSKKPSNSFLLEELNLWLQSIAPIDN